jgi:hypothetical protein
MPALETIRTRAENRLQELSRAYFQYHAGHASDPRTGAIVREYEDLLAPAVQATIRAAWEEADEPVRKQQLGYLYGDCLRNVLRRDLAAPGDVLAAESAKAVVEVDGERFSYPQASIAIGRTADRAKRRRLAEASRAVGASLNGARAALLETEHRLIGGELGLAGYRPFYEMVRGIDFAGLAPACERFLADTRGLYEAEMGPMLEAGLGVGLGEAESHDVLMLRRAADFEADFPADRLVPALQATLTGMGLPAETLTGVNMDLDTRPGKSSRAFCMGVRIPGEVHLCITPTGGPDDYRALFHETGHALHFGHADAALPFEFRYMGDNSVCETFAFVLEHIVLEDAWLTAKLGMTPEAARTFRRTMGRLYLYDLRRFAAKHLFELALHEGGPVAAAAPTYADLLTRHLGVRHYQEDYLAATDGGFYTAQYFRAWCLEAELKTALRAKFGEAWWDAPDAGAYMRGLWSLGQSLPGDQLAARVTGGAAAVSTAPLLAEVRRMLA